MSLLLRLFPLAVALVFSGCAGTADIAIEVRGEIFDGSSQHFELCTLVVYRVSSDEPIASRTVRGGVISEWFTISKIGKGILFEVGCDGADAHYRSKTFTRMNLKPANLGTIKLKNN